MYLIGASLSEPHTCEVNEPPVCIYKYMYNICGDTTNKPRPLAPQPQTF